MADDIVTNLRHEAAQCSASPCVGCENLIAAADEIERLRNLVAELLPFMLEKEGKNPST